MSLKIAALGTQTQTRKDRLFTNRGSSKASVYTSRTEHSWQKHSQMAAIRTKRRDSQVNMPEVFFGPVRSSLGAHQTTKPSSLPYPGSAESCSLHYLGTAVNEAAEEDAPELP